jgi:hypothetical protein
MEKKGDQVEASRLVTQAPLRYTILRSATLCILGKENVSS